MHKNRPARFFPFFDSREWFWIGSVLLLFTAGFVLFHGKEALNSGSWKFVITHNDEYSYWTLAQGASETPTSESNPFYYEERGHRNTIPYTTATLTGWLSKLLHIPVMSFFVPWHIGMPWLTWLIFYLCLTRIWGFARGPSAAVALLSLLTTLYLHGQSQFILMRYSRPGEGLGLLMVWISILMHMNFGRVKLKAFAAGLLAFVLFWLHPYFIIPGAFVAAGEMLWTLRKTRSFKALVPTLLTFAALAAGALTYWAWIRYNMNQNPWVLEFLASNKSSPEERRADFISIAFFTFLAASVYFFKKVFNRPVSRLDRLVLSMFAMMPVVSNVQVFLPHHYHMESHQYYFYPLQFMLLAGWLAEKTAAASKSGSFVKLEPWLITLAAVSQFFIIKHPELNYFRHMPLSGVSYNVFHHSLLLIEILPAIFIGSCLFTRNPAVRTWFSSSLRTSLFLAAMAIGGFSFLPSQLSENNRNYPFLNAYGWLNKNAEPGEVVLTLSPSRLGQEDYLILQTRQKTYLNLHTAHLLSMDEKAKSYRVMFTTCLLLGSLEQVPIDGLTTLEDKLRRLRLDYILLDLPSPFRQRVESQLRNHIEVVHEDPKSVLWKVKTAAV